MLIITLQLENITREFYYSIYLFVDRGKIVVRHFLGVRRDRVGCVLPTSVGDIVLVVSTLGDGFRNRPPSRRKVGASRSLPGFCCKKRAFFRNSCTVRV